MKTKNCLKFKKGVRCPYCNEWIFRRGDLVPDYIVVMILGDSDGDWECPACGKFAGFSAAGTITGRFVLREMYALPEPSCTSGDRDLLMI